MIWVAILALGLVSGTLSGIVGFGASIMLMPVLMLSFCPQEAVPIMAIGITKAIVFQRFNALPLETVGRGVLIGSSLMVGSRLAKGLVLRLDASQFRLLMDCLLIGAGVVLLWGAVALPH